MGCFNDPAWTTTTRRVCGGGWGVVADTNYLYPARWGWINIFSITMYIIRIKIFKAFDISVLIDPYIVVKRRTSVILYQRKTDNVKSCTQTRKFTKYGLRQGGSSLSYSPQTQVPGARTTTRTPKICVPNIFDTSPQNC